MGLYSRVINKITGANKPQGHGPWKEANSGWVDPKPYVNYWNVGLFEGHDGSLMKYYRFPEDVQTLWLQHEEDAITNQRFFVDFMQALGEMLDSQDDNIKKDLRRKYHIHSVQNPTPGVISYPGAPPEHEDYLRRMGERFTKPVWNGYIGIQILPGQFFYETYGVIDRIKRWIDLLGDDELLQWSAYRVDILEVDAIAAKHGFQTLDFIEEPEALEDITAWYGVQDERYQIARRLENQRIQVPVHGKSVITPRWGEMVFHAITPRSGTNLSDPQEARATWMDAVFAPSSDVVVSSIRGQIRAPSIADNMLELMETRRVGKNGIDPADTDLVDSIMAARASVTQYHLPMLDNTEIIVGSLVPDKPQARSRLEIAVGRYGLQIAPLLDRQDIAIHSTLPTYHRHVMRIPRGNAKRPELTNVMLPGIIAFSGMFRSTKPCASRGVALGVSDTGNEMQLIMTETDAANRYSMPPGMLLTGRPGAGKSMELQQISAQLDALLLNQFFFNPKGVGTMKPFFDHIGGVTISLTEKELAENPGMADPVYFLNDRKEVASVLADALFRVMGMYDDKGSTANQRRVRLKAEIQDNAENPSNLTSGDILFGNQRTGTPSLTDKEVLQFIDNKIKVSPFWKAFISRSHSGSYLQRKMRSSRAVLFEWGGGMSLPSANTDPSEYTDDMWDTVLSMTTFFLYAAQRLEETGGAIIVDESASLKSSREVRKVLEEGGRKWRHADIWLIMACQRIADWVTEDDAEDMTSYFSQFLFMAISETSDRELDLFYRMTGLPETASTTHYIRHAGTTQRKNGKLQQGLKIPRAYYVNNIYDWAGGLVCGPWPLEEFQAARTDTKNLQEESEARDREEVDLMTGSTGAISGSMIDIMEDSASILDHARDDGLDYDVDHFGLADRRHDDDENEYEQMMAELDESSSDMR